MRCGPGGGPGGAAWLAYSSESLLARLAVSGAQLLVRTLDAIQQGVIGPVPQSPEGVSLAPKLTVEEVRVDWHRPALAIDRLIRGGTPDPGAWTTIDGDRLGLGPVQMLADDQSLAPGEVASDRAGVRVGTASHAVLLREVRPAGKRAMPAADWARGARLAEGLVLA